MALAQLEQKITQLERDLTDTRKLYSHKAQVCLCTEKELEPEQEPEPEQEQEPELEQEQEQEPEPEPEQEQEQEQISLQKLYCKPECEAARHTRLQTQPLGVLEGKTQPLSQML